MRAVQQNIFHLSIRFSSCYFCPSSQQHTKPNNNHKVDLSGRTFAYVPARVLDGRVSVDVGKQAEAEAVLVVGRVSEAVHQDATGGGVEGLAHTVVQLIVGH